MSFSTIIVAVQQWFVSLPSSIHEFFNMLGNLLGGLVSLFKKPSPKKSGSALNTNQTYGNNPATATVNTIPL
jgi:hypothetical protein